MSDNLMLTRDQILAAQDLTQEEVNVPEWGGTVLIRTLTAAERDDFEASYLLEKNGDIEVDRRNLRARLVARCAVNAEGERIFSDADMDALGRKAAGALDRLYAVATRLNRLTRRDVEELAKN